MPCSQASFVSIQGLRKSQNNLGLEKLNTQRSTSNYFKSVLELTPSSRLPEHLMQEQNIQIINLLNESVRKRRDQLSNIDSMNQTNGRDNEDETKFEAEGEIGDENSEEEDTNIASNVQVNEVNIKQ